MELLISALNAVPEFQNLIAFLERGRSPIAVSGLSGVHRAHFAAALGRNLARPVVLLCADDAEARRLASDLFALTGERALIMPAREYTFHHAAVASREWEHRRLNILWSLLQDTPPAFTILPAEAILQRTMPPDVLKKAVKTLKVGASYPVHELTTLLIQSGYTRCEQVEGAGQFALRGGILDVYSPARSQPVRMEFWGEEVDSMGEFDPGSQRRTGQLDEMLLLPTAEVLPSFAPGGEEGLIHTLEKKLATAEKRKAGNHLLAALREDLEQLKNGLSFPAIDRYLSLVYPDLSTAADFLPQNALVLMCDSSRFTERGKNYLWQLGQDVTALSEGNVLLPELGQYARTVEELASFLESWPVVYLDSFSVSHYPSRPKEQISVSAKQLPSYGVSLEAATSDLSHYLGSGFSTVVLAGSEQRCLNLQKLLRQQKLSTGVDFKLHTLPKPGSAVICRGGLSAGMEYPAAKLAILTEGHAAAPKKQRVKAPTNREKLKSYADLSPGDLVVHQQHGIGRYCGVVTMPVGGVKKDYVKIAYAGADVLYVPATQLDMVSKYIGGGEEANEKKKLSKLGSADWEKQKSRAKKAVQDLAKGLIALYASRQRKPGYAFSPDSEWMHEFEEEFEYTETEDQLRCVAEIKRDMESPRPMDRLLCGDVGYGKTEVAFRAVMKCALDGKQAAILVPTTVLARQHYLTAKQRFAKYPINIETISRFRTSAQVKDTLRRLEEGRVDLLIGTHRLLQKDVHFKDLGLLVVDEEQRFGVTHKEKLKQLSEQVDVLTLSATPIPRTLNMALSGIRDMSTLEEPPQDRQPVQTYVLEHDWSILGDAMRRELERGGQVYYLYNRVENIARVAVKIQEMLGEDVRVAVAHGKMSQAELGNVMACFCEGEADVLVCTTIIETGIDIPNVNTLIIEDADKMGLAQLHQIRGRVGRSSRRAFAYLTFRQGKVLSEAASKRLGAIREFAEFGSGFKIAMRDLEIRGAGNILGAEQSGFLLSVGYDMYLKLLEEAVLTQRGEKVETPAECSADLTVSAFIPDSYVPSSGQRMDLYRRIALVRSERDADDVVDELIDRYGDPPKPVNDLISVALLRAGAARCGIFEISQKGDCVLFSLRDIQAGQISGLCTSKRWQNRAVLSAGEKPSLTLRLKKGEDPLQVARIFVKEYEQMKDGGTPPS